MSTDDQKREAINRIHDIARRAAGEFGVEFKEVFGDSRVTTVAFARHATLTLAHDNYKSMLTDDEIAAIFNRKRQAVQWAVSTVRNLTATDRKFRARMEALKEFDRMKLESEERRSLAECDHEPRR